ncbi:hypothetical protein [Paractinoplanes lichenicola]|uniref:Uncharacterized protein n=1 Tax=Paractinoplanes lichenicola TaxID=2802976 RepID=A0ABS1VNG1_9ACTN|nr:hypothetical protein [Actinoplanes lichenicola]MBL7256271.1 hypothetical protein [Actinoplanes lichenicola]
MSGVELDAWQIPILVTAAVVLVEAAFNLVLRYRGIGPPSQRVRTVGFGLLVVLTVVVFVAALGPTRADQLSSVAAAVAAVVALWLTYRSYNTVTKQTEEAGKPAPEPDDPGES